MNGEPQLTPAQARELTARLRDHCEPFRALSTESVVGALDRVHGAWAAPRSRWRSEAVERLGEVTGYAAPLLDASLRHLFRGLRAAHLRARLADATGRAWLPALDGWHRGRRAMGPRLTVLVASGNVPVAALPSVVDALLARSPCLVKAATVEPVLLPLYARSIGELAPELASFLAVTGWRGGDAVVEGPVWEAAEAVIAYGGDEALGAIRAQLRPDVTFVGHGHRLSAAIVGREALARDSVETTAEALAVDLSAYDQQGCLSPRVVFVEEGGEVSPLEFGAAVAPAMAQQAVRWPPRTLDAAEAAAIHQLRARAEMAAFAADENGLWRSEGVAWTVVLDGGGQFPHGAVNRVAVLRPVSHTDHAVGTLAEWGQALQSVALAGVGERAESLADALAGIGATRLCRLGQAQFPAANTRHDGVNDLAALLRWTTMEG